MSKDEILEVLALHTSNNDDLGGDTVYALLCPEHRGGVIFVRAVDAADAEVSLHHTTCKYIAVALTLTPAIAVELVRDAVRTAEALHEPGGPDLPPLPPNTPPALPPRPDK